MATIADVFLEDFEEEEQLEANSNAVNPGFDVEVVTVDMDLDSDAAESNEKVTDLLEDEKLRKLIEKTERLLLGPAPSNFSALSEGSPEYKTMQEVNEMAKKIEQEIYSIHRLACDLYASRFPELEQTVLHPVHYARVVASVGNQIEKVSEALEGLASDHIKLSATISASATVGKPLPESDLRRVKKICSVVIRLDESRNKLIKYAKSRILKIAPNLSALVGPEVAVQLITLAGGISSMQKIPSCNIQSLGSTKQSKETSSTAVCNRDRTGVLRKTNVILECPEELVQKALRMLASKIALAVRIDCNQTRHSDKMGVKYLEDIKTKIAKWQEAPEMKEVKPLIIQMEQRKSKRAGKRYRKQREKFKVTELQRMRNRVGFNVGEDAGEDGEGFGMIGKTGTGGLLKVNAAASTRVRKLEKINKMEIERERKRRRGRISRGASSGLATSVVMNETQGMSFVNPEASAVKGEKTGGTSTYFGTKSFTRIKL